MDYGRDRSRRGRHVVLQGSTGKSLSAVVCGAVALVMAGAVPAAAGVQQPTTAAPSLVFDGVTVVDVEHGKLLPDQRVVIVGNRIQAVGDGGAVKTPTGAQVVDARGKYLIPGLWDMHTHAASSRNILIASGITGIREMASGWPEEFNAIRQQRREIAAGTLVGPRILVTSRDFYSPLCSPMALTFGAAIGLTLEKSGCMSMNGNTVTTPEQTRAIVDTLKEAGADFAKAHVVSDPKVYYAFLSEARRVGIPAVGHLTGPDRRALTEIEASDSGLRTVEHINEMSCWQGLSSDGHGTGVVLPDSVAEKQCGAVAEHFKRNGTWLVPTLYTFSDSNSLRGVGLLHRAGVPLLAGTDAGYPPDSGKQPFKTALHDELGLLVGVGLTPLDALRAATLGPAQMLRATDSLGTIAAGKLADAVLLDADPLADITNTTKIRAVVANGRYFDRAALDGLLTDSQAKGKQNGLPEKPPEP